MSLYCFTPKTLLLIFSVCFHVEMVVSVWGVPNVTIPKAEYSGGYGGNITLECLVDSTPNHTEVYWQHISNGTIKNITSSSPNVANGATISEPSLSIRHITYNDDGQYICFAVNIIGTGESTPTSLTVLGEFNSTIDSNADTDYTDTVVNGIIGAVSAVAGVGSLVITYWTYKRSKKQEDQKGKQYQTTPNDSRNTSRTLQELGMDLK